MLERHRIVLAFAVGAFFELGLKALLGFLQLLDDASRVAFLGLGLADGLFELVFLFIDKAGEGLVRNRQQLERLVRDDDRIIVPCSNSGHRLLAIACGEGIFTGDVDVGLWVKLKERRARDAAVGQTATRL